MNTITQKKRDIKNKTMKGGMYRPNPIPWEGWASLLPSWLFQNPTPGIPEIQTPRPESKMTEFILEGPGTEQPYKNIFTCYKLLLKIIPQNTAYNYIVNDINNVYAELIRNMKGVSQHLINTRYNVQILMYDDKKIRTTLNNNPIPENKYKWFMTIYNQFIQIKNIPPNYNFTAFNYIIRDKTKERIDNTITVLDEIKHTTDKITQDIIFDIFSKLNRSQKSILADEKKYLKLNKLIEKFYSLNKIHVVINNIRSVSENMIRIKSNYQDTYNIDTNPYIHTVSVDTIDIDDLSLNLLNFTILIDIFIHILNSIID